MDRIEELIKEIKWLEARASASKYPNDGYLEVDICWVGEKNQIKSNYYSILSAYPI